MTSSDSLKRFIDTMNSAEVNGTVFRDVNRIFGDTQASIDRMSNSWEKLKTSLGESVAPAVTPLMDGAVKQLDRYNARQRGMEKRGWGWFRRNMGIITNQEEMDLAYEGGYRDEKFLGEYWASRYGAGRDDPRRPRASTGRQGRPVVIGDFPGGGHGYTNGTLPAGSAPVPAPRPREIPSGPSTVSDLQRQYREYGQGRVAGQKISTEVANMDVFRGIRERLEQSTEIAGSQAGKSIADGGQTAAAAIESGSQKLQTAGDSFLSGLSAAAQKLFDAANRLQNIRINASAIGAQGGRALANADTGRTFPPDISKPTGAQ